MREGREVMRAVIEIEMDGALAEEPASELAALLRRLAYGIERHGVGAFGPATLRDSNGNTVGTFKVEG